MRVFLCLLERKINNLAVFSVLSSLFCIVQAYK